MFYNSLFHFLNNGVITALMLLVRSFMKFSPSYRKMFEYTLEEMPSGQMTLAAVGLYWIFAAAAPFLIYLGYWMLPKEQGRRKPLFGGGTLVRDVLVIVTASAVFLAGGFLCLLTSLR